MIDWLVPKTALPAALGVPQDSPAELAIMLLESTVIIVGIILLLTGIARESPSSLLLKRGRVRVWLPIGVGAVVFFAVTALYAATNLFQGSELSWGRVLGWVPWIALFVLSNGLREELWFRGVMLPRFTPHIGAPTTIVVSSLVFALAHAGVDYTPVLLPFMGVTLILGLTFGTLAHRTDSLWGAVLFHAGADIPVVIGIMSNL
jgi:membrane protease YdiL (CAAX protease family)